MAKRTKKTDAPAVPPTAPETLPAAAVKGPDIGSNFDTVTVNEKELVDYFRKAILGSPGTTGHAAKSAFKKITGREWA